MVRYFNLTMIGLLQGSVAYYFAKSFIDVSIDLDCWLLAHSHCCYLHFILHTFVYYTHRPKKIAKGKMANGRRKYLVCFELGVSGETVE